MNLRTQIVLLISFLVLASVSIAAFVSIQTICRQGHTDIESYRQEQLTEMKVYLKHLVDIGYGMVDVNYRQHANMDETLQKLSEVRFDGGEGYFVITDKTIPYPTMVMHPIRPELTGKVLDSPKYNVTKSMHQNIYQARVLQCRQKGEAYLEYIFKKPGTDAIENKISYSRLFSPLGWVITSGLYTDSIESKVENKRNLINHRIRSTVTTILLTSVLLLMIGISAALYFSNQLTKAVQEIVVRVNDLAEGREIEPLTVSRQDEIGVMMQSLNKLFTGIRSYTTFAREVGKNNLLFDFKPLSKEDVLGNELLRMRDNIRKTDEEEKSRRWISDGASLFNDTLRKTYSSSKALGDQLTTNLVKYLDANQAGLFILQNDQEDYLELVSCYAFSRKKFLQKRIGIGQGLVGQCALEKGVILLSAVPEDYLTLTSGLGDAPPRYLALIPLIHYETLYGVLELASFKPFLPHHITFLKEVGENIAGGIATVKVTEQTSKLLLESRQLAEELRSQEEELRQNQEEMQATQEEMPPTDGTGGGKRPTPGRVKTIKER